MPDRILAFDTALGGCAAALHDGSRALASEILPTARGQAELLMPMIGRVLAAADTGYADLDLIAVTVGPGAFTGLRIGMATAQALGLALEIPVVGVTTTAVLAAQYRATHALAAEDTLAVILETKRRDFYVEYFGARASPIAAGEAGDIVGASAGTAMLAIGDAIGRFASEVDTPGWQFIDGYAHPDPAVLAALALQSFRDDPSRPLAPVYLRPPDVTASKKILRTLGA